MASKLSNIKTGYRMFYEDGPLSNGVYSPIPEKYLKKGTVKTFGMVLRSRIPLKQLNSNFQKLPNECFDEVAQKNNDRNRKNSTLKRKMQEKVDYVKEVMTKKAKTLKFDAKENKSNQLSSPMTRYRGRLASSPITPNPFQYDSPIPRYSRRSKSFSGHNEIKPLDVVECGIGKLQSNSKNLNSAIKKLEKIKVAEGESVSSPQSSYQSLGARPLKRSNTMRRTMSRVAVKSRNLSSRFAKSASTLNARFNGYGGVDPTVRPSRVRGWANDVDD